MIKILMSIVYLLIWRHNWIYGYGKPIHPLVSRQGFHRVFLPIVCHVTKGIVGLDFRWKYDFKLFPAKKLTLSLVNLAGQFFGGK